MAGKTGMTHHQPARTPKRDGLAPGDNLGDPAKGEKVPRCSICGMPERPGIPLLPGYWAYAARTGIDLVICERDYLARVPRFDPNQITLDEVA